jgi:hypothetical protein
MAPTGQRLAGLGQALKTWLSAGQAACGRLSTPLDTPRHKCLLENIIKIEFHFGYIFNHGGSERLFWLVQKSIKKKDQTADQMPSSSRETADQLLIPTRETADQMPILTGETADQMVIPTRQAVDQMPPGKLLINCQFPPAGDGVIFGELKRGEARRGEARRVEASSKT